MAKRKINNYALLSGYDYFVPNISQLFILLAFIILGVVLGNLVTLALSLIPGMGQDAMMIVSYPLMFIPAMIYAKSRSRNMSIGGEGLKLDSRTFSPLSLSKCILLAIGGAVAMWFFSDPLGRLLPEPGEMIKQLLESMTQGNMILNFISVCIFAPFFEEWLCRGMVLRGLLGSNVKPAWAIVISALFFALIHMNPWQALPAFVIGSMMGYVYYRTGSLKLTMLMHFTNNFLSLVLSNIDALKDVESWAEVLPAPSYWDLVALSVLVAAVVIVCFSRIPASPTGGLEKRKALIEQ